MDEARDNALALIFAWSNFVHQLFDKPGFGLVVAVWLGIATVLVPNNRPAKYFGIALFVIAALFALSWLLPSGQRAFFYTYNQGAFRVAVPSDLRSTEQSARGTYFHGASPDRSLLLSTGEWSGSTSVWLKVLFSYDSTTATAAHVPQPRATATAYIFPDDGPTKSWSPEADYYVVSWDDRDGIDHYKAVAAVQDEGRVKWASFELLNPLAGRPSRCRNGTAYMLDTFLVSAGVKFVARDPQCPHPAEL
jgi:hypothetical protein